jgi:hypothetical protein
MKLRDQLPGFKASTYYEAILDKPIQFVGGQVTEHNFRLRFKKKLTQKSPLRRMLQFKAVIGHAVYTLFHDLDPDLVAQIFVENSSLENTVRTLIFLKVGWLK